MALLSLWGTNTWVLSIDVDEVLVPRVPHSNKDNGDGACTKSEGVALLRQYDMIQADTAIQPKVRSCCVCVYVEGDNMESDGKLLLHVGVDTYHGRTTISCARR